MKIDKILEQKKKIAVLRLENLIVGRHVYGFAAYIHALFVDSAALMPNDE